MKLPTFKDLKTSVKSLLLAKDYPTYSEFKNAHSRAFIRKLGAYLTNIGAHSSENFSKMYQILFYHGYINFKKEQELVKLLQQAGFVASQTNLFQDGILGVDIAAKKGTVELLIQVKPNSKLTDPKKLLKLANNRTKFAILAWKVGKTWSFFNLLTSKAWIFSDIMKLDS